MVVLGLSISLKVVESFSISYPFTNAFPHETWYTPRSSLANAPWLVDWPEFHIPSLLIPLFKEFLTLILNGLTV